MFHTIHHGTLEYLTADALSGSVHCFSTRFGGVSEGALSSLNLGTHRGDRPENVRENYRILGTAVGFSPEETIFTGRSIPIFCCASASRTAAQGWSGSRPPSATGF